MSWFLKTFCVCVCLFCLSVCLSACLVAQSCLTLCNPLHCSPPDSSVHSIFFWQEYWNELPFLSPGIFPTQGSKLSHLCFLQCRRILYPLSVSVVVQSLSRIQFFATPWTAAHQVSLSFTISQSLLKLRSIESVMPFNHLIFCHPLLFCPQSFPTLGSFPMSHFFESGDESTGASTFASVLPVNI